MWPPEEEKVHTPTWRRRFRGISAPLSLGMMFLVAAILFGGAASFHVKLHAPQYVVRDGSAILTCDHSVDRVLLHKVEWLKNGDRKVFQFVRGRKPPFRNFSIPGATLDWSRSNEREIRLTGLDLEASGVYSCEVSMETPIYTKPSNDEVITVIQRQAQDPEVWGRKPSYVVGESLEVNCTSSPSHPPAHITWLVNGRQVSEKSLRWFSGPLFHLHHRQYGRVVHHHHHHHHHQRGSGGIRRVHRNRNQYRVHSREEEEDANDERLDAEDADDFDMGFDRGPAVLPAMSLAPSSSTVQLTFQISEETALEGVTEGENEATSEAYEGNTIVNGRIAITCLATIPAFLGAGFRDHEYADHRLTSVDVDVIIPPKVVPVKEEPVVEVQEEKMVFNSARRPTFSLFHTLVPFLPLLTSYLISIFLFSHVKIFPMDLDQRLQSLVVANCGIPKHACPCR